MGDLVFWATDPTDAWDVYHVGIYLGSGLIVEAPYTGAKVRITALRTNALVGQVIRPTATLRWPVAPNTTSSTVTVLQRLLRVPLTGTGPATARLPKKHARPKPAASPSAPASPSTGASASTVPTPSPTPSVASSPSPSPSASGH
jgi:hypothetical protein